jgi:chemotaxis protein histidine kinase CheA
MPQKGKKIKGRYTQPFILLPITTTLIVNKTSSKEPEHKDLDFHLEMINKIDKLLANHQQEVLPGESFHTPPMNPPSPPTPIEPRPPLNKEFPHQEIAWEPNSESQNMIPTIPEEFKTEISFNPEFRFITSHEFTDTIAQTQPSSEDRVEIIDCNTLINDNTAFHKHIDIPPIINLKNERDTSPFKHILIDEDHRNKKIEIIDTRTQKQKRYENVLSASAEQAEQIDKKAQLYFLNSKDSTDKKQHKLDVEQTTISADLEEQSKELKKKLTEEEKKLKQLEHEYEKLEKMEKKKTAVTEKEKLPSKKEQPQPRSQREIKKQQKEQKRLKRLQIRQTRIEERQRKKLEKQALKLKQKQQHFKMKGNKQQQSTGKGDALNKEKQASALLFDDELIKVLHMTDSLLGELPDDILNDFIESSNYKLYEKVMNKYKIK